MVNYGKNQKPKDQSLEGSHKGGNLFDQLHAAGFGGNIKTEPLSGDEMALLQGIPTKPFSWDLLKERGIITYIETKYETKLTPINHVLWIVGVYSYSYKVSTVGHTTPEELTLERLVPIKFW